MEAPGRKPCRALDLFYACDLAFCLSPLAFPLKEKCLPLSVELAVWAKAVGRCAKRIVQAAKFGKLPCGQRLRPVVNRLRVVHGLQTLRAAHCPQRRLTNICLKIYLSRYLKSNTCRGGWRLYRPRFTRPVTDYTSQIHYRLHVSPLPITRGFITDYTWISFTDRPATRAGWAFARLLPITRG